MFARRTILKMARYQGEIPWEEYHALHPGVPETSDREGKYLDYGETVFLTVKAKWVDKLEPYFNDEVVLE